MALRLLKSKQHALMTKIHFLNWIKYKLSNADIAMFNVSYIENINLLLQKKLRINIPTYFTCTHNMYIIFEIKRQ